MIVVIDNYDSFTFNIVQLLGTLGAQPVVFRNDELSVAALQNMKPKGIVISSGTGTPSGAGVSTAVVQRFGADVPLLGIGLGHHCIASVFGARSVPSSMAMHGKPSMIEHDGHGLFADLDGAFVATRYDSLVVDESSLPDCLDVSAVAHGEGEVMGIRHRTLPVEGVQFHPESVLTVQGRHIVQNFLHMTGVVRAA